MFKYDREKHVEYLENLKRKGTYEEYQQEMEKLQELGAKIREKGHSINIVVDQADGVYWGDIFFHLNSKPNNEDAIAFKAGEICGILSNFGIPVSVDAVYYNRTFNGLMYTMVAIEADGPELYPEEVRLNRDTFLMR